jgi:FtsZ-interacting cell division protein YlmF
MNTEDIIRMAREAGFWREHTNTWMGSSEDLGFFALAIAKEREARQAAQIENEQLKARLARADLEQQRAVMAEREACAKVAERHGAHPQLNVAFGGPDWYKHGKEIAAVIRARKDNT